MPYCDNSSRRITAINRASFLQRLANFLQGARLRRRFVLLLITLGAPLSAAPIKDYPVILSTIPNLNDYSLFANAGWDGNWYVGYNTCWVKELPPAPAGRYAHAYIGVKLGRAKIAPGNAKPWARQAIAGAIYAALSSTTSWSANQYRLVTTSDDIPFEGDGENAIEGVGEAQWFWTEVPTSQVQTRNPNFVAVWSNTPDLLTVSSSPVLAAGWGPKTVSTWLLRAVHGAPPPAVRFDTSAGLSYFQPAIALKLISADTPAHPLQVKLANWIDGTSDHPRPILVASVSGDSVERVWVEYKPAGTQSVWQRVGRSLHEAPYSFSIDISRLPPGRVRLRISARNFWEEEASSDAFTVAVSTRS